MDYLLIEPNLQNNIRLTNSSLHALLLHLLHPVDLAYGERRVEVLT